MANLARPMHRALPQHRPTAGKTKVLLLRQPIKSVQREDDSGPAGFRLSLGLVVAAGGIAITWLVGFLGFRLGFAGMLGLPELLTDPGAGLATGARVLMSLPMRVFEAGMAEPMWLMGAFVVIAGAGGGLAAAKRPVRGGPKPSSFFVGMSWTGSISAAVFGAGIVGYVVAPFRTSWLGPLPTELSGFDQWLRGWSLAAGLDVLMLIAGILWMVLSFRLAVPVWMKAISISLTLFAVVVATVGMAISNATVAELNAERSLISFTNSNVPPSLLVGYTREHAVMLDAGSGGSVQFGMFDVPTQLTIMGRQSLADLLMENMPEEQ